MSSQGGASAPSRPRSRGGGAERAHRILLVRHAEAGERKLWRGDDRARPLTGAGLAQADLLAASFDAYPLSRILTSGYARCVETVAPLAARRGLAPESAAWLEEGADPTAALRALLAAGDVAASTHGDIVSGILVELAGAGVDIGPSPRMQKGSTWVMAAEAGRVSAARYLPPPG
ncbi:MAG TPA: phosphoglycerate mutase family protein [Candidatus Binatia bacterium]|nr:phosphoglycerate mutase family protein [Candidatus Binatia bacterium]